jgi:hypothetical protein
VIAKGLKQKVKIIKVKIIEVKIIKVKIIEPFLIILPALAPAAPRGAAGQGLQ